MSKSKDDRTNASQAKTSGVEPDEGYFHIYLQAMGYLNSVEVNSKAADDTKVYVKFAALKGAADKVKYTYFDLLVTKEELRELIVSHREEIENKDTKVFVQLRVSDPYPKPFTYGKDHARAGELGATTGGFLYRIESMKIDGNLVYEYKQEEEAA